MFKSLRKCSRGVITIEFVAMVTILLMVLLFFGRYIQNAFSGRWKAAGEAVGQGRQYDPRGFGTSGEGGGTRDCFFDTAVNDVTTNHWIDDRCYRENNCDCTLIKFDGGKAPGYETQCEQCKSNCMKDAQCAPNP